MPLFGKSFTYTFTPLAEDAPVGAIPAQSPAIFLFATLPSYAQARAGTGAVAAVTAWTPVADGFEFTVPAIDDPAPDSATREWTYYLAISFVLEASEQQQTVLRALEFERVTGSEGKVAVSDADILALLPQATSFSSEAERIAFVRQATLQVKDDLKANKFSWAQVRRLDDLSRLVLYRALLLLLFSQFRDGGDRYKAKYDEIKGWYKEAFASVEFDYLDEQGTSEAASGVSGGMSSVTFAR